MLGDWYANVLFWRPQVAMFDALRSFGLGVRPDPSPQTV